MKTLFLLSLSLLFVTQAYSQLSLGLKAGGNCSVMNHTEEPDYPASTVTFNEQVEWRTGAQLGLQFAYRITSFELAADILFAQKGHIRSFDNVFSTNDPVEFRMRVNYLGLPIIARYYLSDNFYMGAGGEVAYMLSSKVKDSRDNATVNHLSEEYPLEVNRLDIGILAEIGLKLDMGLGLQLRYIQGLNDYYGGDLQYTDINGEPLEDFDSKFRNRSLQLSLTMDLIKVEGNE